jgi:hypothetical protein
MDGVVRELKSLRRRARNAPQQHEWRQEERTRHVLKARAFAAERAFHKSVDLSYLAIVAFLLKSGILAILSGEGYLPSDTTIVCPKCGTAIPLTETLAAPFILEARKKLETESAARELALAKRESETRAAEAKVAAERATIADQVAAQLRVDRAAIVEQEAKKAREAVSGVLRKTETESAELREQLKEKDSKLEEAQKAEIEARKTKREFEDKTRELDLIVEKRVSESRNAERDKGRVEAEEASRLRMAEKDKMIDDQRRQLAEAQRKLEQGSQQLQGEVQELDLEQSLRTAFPRDTIEPVPKGQYGGDALHRVLGPTAQVCGTILWESKRTKNWSPSWLPKLRDDQRAAKAEIAAVVSQVLPEGIESFGQVDGVWVMTPRAVLPVAMALRQMLVEVSLARVASEGQETKAHMVYQYCMGTRFRQRVQAIVEAFSCMQEDLDKEKKAIIKQWAKREEQIERVMQSTAGMFGELQGIAGKSLQEIDGLDFKAIGDQSSPRSV